MMKYLLAFSCFATTYCCALTWEQVIEDRRGELTENSILLEQYRSFASFNAPIISDPIIKMIPIYEDGEELVDVKKIGNGRIQMMPDPSFSFESPSFNSGLPSASKMRSGLYTKLQIMLELLDRLSFHFGYEPGQVCIRVFEGLRDLSTQQELFQKKVEEILSIQPHLTIEKAEYEASKWVSPFKNNVPVHSTGAAVDIRLWDNRKSEFLDMGAFGVIWGENKTAPTFSEEISDLQKLNRLFCLIAAEGAGLTNYVYEFWHFSSQDRYAAYWSEKNPDKRRATYGAIQ